MSAAPQMGFASFNSLLRDFMVGFVSLILLIYFNIKYIKEMLNQFINYINCINSLSIGIINSNNLSIDFLFIIFIFVLSIIIGLFIDGIGHIFTDFICKPTYEWFIFKDSEKNKEYMNIYGLLENYNNEFCIHKAINNTIHKTKEYSDISYIKEKTRWLFYSNARDGILNERHELWMFYEFYRNIGLVILVTLISLMLSNYSSIISCKFIIALIIYTIIILIYCFLENFEKALEYLFENLNVPFFTQRIGIVLIITSAYTMIPFYLLEDNKYQIASWILLILLAISARTAKIAFTKFHEIENKFVIGYLISELRKKNNP
jgi:hypothetical protein